MWIKTQDGTYFNLERATEVKAVLAIENSQPVYKVGAYVVMGETRDRTVLGIYKDSGKAENALGKIFENLGRISPDAVFEMPE